MLEAHSPFENNNDFPSLGKINISKVIIKPESMCLSQTIQLQ